MKIYFVRHGETDWNFEGRLMGRGNDESLNKKGIEQAHALAEKIDKDFEVLFSSPLKRASQTAEIIGQSLKLPVLFRTEVMEWDAGSLGGKKWSEIPMITNGMVSIEKLDKELGANFDKYGGEKNEEIRDRVKKFIDEVKKDFNGKKVLVVTHGGIIRTVHGLYSILLPGRPKLLGVYEFEI